MTADEDWTAEACGPDAWLVRFGTDLGERTLHAGWSISHSLERMPPRGLAEFTMGYAAVLLEFETGLRPAAAQILEELRRTVKGDPPPFGRRVEIPVVYDGEDLHEVAERTGLSPAEVVHCHAARDYRVWLLGFAPGFPYLGILDERLRLPRRDTPRTSVPAGSVAIAGDQTGVYPSSVAGGWHLIGHTSRMLFDPAREDAPFALRPGDTVRFIPV